MLFFHQVDYDLSCLITFNPYFQIYNGHESLHKALLEASYKYPKMSPVKKTLTCANVANLLQAKALGHDYYYGKARRYPSRVKARHLLKIYPNIKTAVLLDPSRNIVETINIEGYLFQYKGRKLSQQLIKLLKNNRMVNEEDKVNTLFSNSRIIKKRAR